ncbi:hypothetical protein Tco_1497456, partial [Tanacetum coccineum]
LALETSSKRYLSSTRLLHDHFISSKVGQVLLNLWQCALAPQLEQTSQQTCDEIWTLQLTCQLS